MSPLEVMLRVQGRSTQDAILQSDDSEVEVNIESWEAQLLVAEATRLEGMNKLCLLQLPAPHFKAGDQVAIFNRTSRDSLL